MLPIYERFASKIGEITVPPTDETPDFQRHVSPLLGRLGCNGRACHGSFQGQGGFQLSLFGYDFKADHAALMDEESPRIDLEDKSESMLLTYPSDADAHGGGQRFKPGSWEYWVLRSWVEAGADFSPGKVQKLERLEVQPSTIDFQHDGQAAQLKVIAHWEDGTNEDVTCLCRFHTNDSAITQIDESGIVTSEDVGDTHVVVSYDKAVVPVQTLRAVSSRVGDSYPAIAASTEVDRLVIAKLRKLGIVPSDLCTDAEFLRRVSLDMTGTLPTASEVQAFLDDSAADKRQRKVAELLERPTYAARWTTFFCDMTGNNDDQLNNVLPNVQGSQSKPDSQWYHWIFDRVERNVPYDEMVAGIVTASSRLPGESYRDYCDSMSEICRDDNGDMYAERPGLVHYWARRNFQSAEDRAIGFAYSFLGVRIQCAQCHKHPFDQWSKDDFDNFEKLFANVQTRANSMTPEGKKVSKELIEELGVDSKLRNNQLRREFGKHIANGKTVPFPELVVGQPRQRGSKNRGRGKASAAPKARLLGGDWVDMTGDPRELLMQWLRSPDNPYFAKAIVNRVWAQYFSVGIINPVDDINLANAPSNGPLLDYLADGLRDNNFDLKWLHREIVLSDTYQRSWQPNATNESDKHNFSRALLRRLPAETSYDALRQALVDDTYANRSQQLDAPRAHLIAGSSTRKLASGNDTLYALNIFGRNVRESNCDCDRSEEPSLLQTVFVLNDDAVLSWIEDPKASWVRQIADKFDWPKPTGKGRASAAKQKQLEQLLGRLKQQHDAYITRLNTAQKRGNEKIVAQIQKGRKQQLAKVRQAAKRNGFLPQVNKWLAANVESKPSPSEPTQSPTASATPTEAQWVVKQAYLRTLNRLPSENERDIATHFILDEDNPTAGVVGLMWSLVNTKEFILNH
ncbi:MAG TPA: hypothetical protein DDW52_15845 [Planctomycetaceae bacterium]|nr:hypothetical protein [Planctomycetaceae bacterium]